MTTVLSPDTKQRFFDNNGNPLAFGLLTSYAAGTATPIATYKDSTGLSLNTNPIQLNFRGEADIWLQPNIAYKFALTDSLNNTIPGWPIDNIVNSQLITLYGGVDTGSANAYLLSFTANFTAYIDGIIIYWIPAHTNTGASTINVNGLGVVNIINPDGSNLSANQILANQPAQILFKGGSFELITPATAQVNSFAPAYTGFSSSPASFVQYRRVGNIVVLSFFGTGSSNSTSFALTNLPAALQSAIFAQTVPCMGMTDNGTIQTNSVAQVLNSGTINFYRDANLTAWTNSGTKGFRSADSFISITYVL